MSTITNPDATSPPLRLARHAVGLMLAGLANPLIYFSREPFEAWLATVFGAAIFATAIYGVFWLFFTRRARTAGLGRFFLVLWFSMGLMLLGSWSRPDLAPGAGRVAAPAQEPISEIDQFLKDAPKAKQSASNEQFIDGPYNPNDRRVTEPNWERGAITPPPATVQSSSNPFSDPDFGKEQLPTGAKQAGRTAPLSEIEQILNESERKNQGAR